MKIWWMTREHGGMIRTIGRSKRSEMRDGDDAYTTSAAVPRDGLSVDLFIISISACDLPHTSSDPISFQSGFAMSDP